MIGISDFDEFFFKMQVISTAFTTARYGFREMGYELLGMLERVVTRNSYSFHHENNKKLVIFYIFIFKRLHLSCSVELGSWEFLVAQ